MKCPHCNKEMPGIVCQGCNSEIPEHSKYCLYCGLGLEDKLDHEDDILDSGEEDDFDLEDRIPCSDGNCIGIIINERCNICGKRSQRKKT
jgi:hypothetical protein